MLRPPELNFPSARARWLLVASLVAMGNTVSWEDDRASADWPTYRGDNTRSGFHHQSDIRAVELPGELVWHYSTPQTPQPAWPPPARGSYWQQLSYIAPRIVDDNTFHPVIADGHVLFGSSADDSIYCLDFSTGQLRWRTTTGGPIRYAPTVAAGKVYVGSDDGHVYCCDLTDGRLLWQRRLATSDRLLPGNGRLISPWPIRTGVVVDHGIAYAAAGLYPSQGVFVCALDAETGQELWKSQIDYATHGYSLLTDDYLVIPTGRSTPVLLRRADGAVVGQLPGAPGSYAVVAGDQVLSGRGNDGSLTASNFESQQSLLSFQAEQICAGTEASYLLSRNRLTALRLAAFVDNTRQLGLLEDKRGAIASKKPGGDQPLDEARRQSDSQAKGLEQEIARVKRARDACRLWEGPVARAGCIAACNEFVAVGGERRIELRSPVDGSILKELPLEGRVLGLALAGDGLVAATEVGEIVCYAASPRNSPQVQQVNTNQVESASPRDRGWNENIAKLVDEFLIPAFGSTRGYALVLGANDKQLIHALAGTTEYTIVVVDDDANQIDLLRQQLVGAGSYGSRVAALQVPAGDLPFADYVFNLVASPQSFGGGTETRWSREEIRRVTRPLGGVAWLSLDTPTQRGALAGAGKWVHQYGNTANTAASGDQHLGRPLRLQWFGGPGPARMVDRHLRAPAPLAKEGRMFVAGENSLICVDSFNGTEYWQLDVPHSQRYSMPYDCGYMSTHASRFAIAVQDQLWLMDAVHGRVEEKLTVPSEKDELDCHWGYVALSGTHIYGSRQLATASRTQPSRQQIDIDYRNDQPVVTSRSVFAMDRAGELIWEYRGVILNPTITIADDVVYFVATHDQAMTRHATGRIHLRDFLSHAPELVALNAGTGIEIWRQDLPADMAKCRNILYLQATADYLILSGSRLQDGDSWYRVAVLHRETAETAWSSEHAKGRAGAFTHGEQLHHPVVLGNVLVCEPILYDLSTGQRTAPPGEPKNWRIERPGHSCGTMSGAGNCLLFRANNPTLLDLSSESAGSERFFRISPTRPGCWINIIPADGLVLIPEASASCVCHYSLQTSMAFQSVPPAEKSVR